MKTSKYRCNVLIFCVAIWIFVTQKTYASPDASFLINPELISIEKGTTFNVDILLYPGSHPVSNADLYINFDQSKLKLKKISGSGPFSQILASSVSDGSAIFSAGTPFGASVSSSAKFATFNFEALPNLDKTEIVIDSKTAAYSDDEPGTNELSKTNVAIIKIKDAPNIIASKDNEGVENNYNNDIIKIDKKNNNQSFKINLTEKIPVPAVTRDRTPDYSFSTQKTGAIKFEGECNSETMSAKKGVNLISFNPLLVGMHANCSMQIIDANGNVSNILAITPFTVTYLADINMDRTVDGADFGLLHSYYGNIESGYFPDVNSDGLINNEDYNLLKMDYGNNL